MDPIIIGILIGIIPTCLILGLWLRQVYSEKDSLTTNLTQANQRNQGLSTELEEVKQDRSRLRSDLENASQRNEELEQEVTTLTGSLVEVSQSNENALWLLYLSEQSLQSCGGALLSEQHRSKHLIGIYQGLEQNYETLHQGYGKTAAAYGAFREKVHRKARRRLVKKGIGVVLSFVPGVGLIDVLSDLGEIASTAAEAAETTDEILSTLNELPDPGGLSTDAAFEPLSFSTDGEEILPTGLTQEAQDAVNKVLAQSLSEAGETPSPDAFSAFALGAIQRLESQVDAEQNEGIQRAMTIAKTANNFRQFGVQVYDYHGSRDSQQEKNRSSSGDEA